MLRHICTLLTCIVCVMLFVGLLTQMSAGENIVQDISSHAKTCLNKHNILTQSLFSNICRYIMVNRWLGTNLFWHQNGSNLIEVLFARGGPDTAIVYQSWRSLKTKVFIILSQLGALSQTCFGATQKSWHPDPPIEKDHQWFISQGSRPVWRISLFGKVRSVLEIRWEASRRGCKLMVIRAAGMRAGTRSENLAQAELAKQIELLERLMMLKCNLQLRVIAAKLCRRIISKSVWGLNSFCSRGIRNMSFRSNWPMI